MSDNKKSIENTFKELEDILNVLEKRDTPLEEAFNKYEQGIKLIKQCNEDLDKVEKDILVLQSEE